MRSQRLFLFIPLAVAFEPGCVVVTDDGDDEGTGVADTGGDGMDDSPDAGSDGVADGVDDGADDGMEDGVDSTGAADGMDDGGELSPECTALCGHTETATELQADCVPIVLSEEGGYLFTEPECVALAEAYENGVATSDMCVTCYLAAGVEAAHCSTAESSCF